MKYFYDLAEIEPQKMPGRERRLVVGEQVMMLYIEREGGTEQDHTHDVEQLVYLMKGEATFTVAGETRNVKAGQVVHIPKGVPHRLDAPTPITYIGIYSPLREEAIRAEA